MATQVEELDSELRQLSSSMRDLERRVTALESARASVEISDVLPHPAEVTQAAGGRLLPAVPLVGRTLLVFGGAFLLRAITDLGAMPSALGLLLGFVYAMYWLLAADRSAAASEKRLGAHFHLVAGAGIAFPLIVEAASRFQLLPVAGAAAAVVLVAAVLLLVGARRRLNSAVALASVGGGLTSLALLRHFAEPAPVLILALSLGLAVLSIGYRQGWRVWSWVSALLADIPFAIVALGFGTGRFEIGLELAVALQLGLFAGYLALFGAWTLRRGRDVGALEVVQTTLAALVAFGGAAKMGGEDQLLPALAALLLGAAAYGVAFSSGMRHERRRNFFFFTSLGLALIGIGSLELLPSSGAALVWAVLGIACALLSARFGRVTLTLHCSIYLLAAMAASGLAQTATAAFWMPDPANWTPLHSPQPAVVGAMILCLAIPAARTSETWGRLALVPRAALLLFAVWATGGALLAGLVPRLVGAGRELDAGALATSRTGLLAISAVLLAWLSRRPRFSEAGWWVYPLLGVAGLRVLSQDLLQGRPLTLFVSLALLGASLMASARWLRSEDAGRPTGT